MPYSKSSDRGAGSIPNKYPGRQRIEVFCYDYCPSGYYPWAFGCYRRYPHGVADQGLFCRKSEYWRPGYPWKWWDGWDDGKLWQRCRKDHGHHGCEKWGAIVYANVSQDSTLLVAVSVDRPNCGALGMVFSLIYPVRRNIGKENLMV